RSCTAAQAAWTIICPWMPVEDGQEAIEEDRMVLPGIQGNVRGLADLMIALASFPAPGSSSISRLSPIAEQDSATSESSQSSDPGQPRDELRRGYLLRRFWRSACGFWTHSARSLAWMYSAALLLIIILVVGAAYAMNAWNRAIFDGLQNRDTAAVAGLSMLYFAILAVSVLLSVVQVYLRMLLQRRWRSWLNDHLVDRWLAHGR